jgi:cytochrome c oxidase subunit II
VHRRLFGYEMKSSALIRRTMFLVLALLVPAVTVYAGDWGMGQANARLPHPSMFQPISTLAVFVLVVTTAIFVIVSALFTYRLIRFRARPGDGSEPPQLYGSAPVAFAWTAVPVLIVFVLILTTARSVYTVQAARRPSRSVAVRVVGHQWWWESQYPELGIVTANEVHVPLSDSRDPMPTFLVMRHPLR